MIEFRTNSAQSLLVFEQEIGTRSGLAEMPAAATLNTLFVFHFFRHLAPAAARLGMPAAATPNLDVCADSFLHPFIPVFRSVSAAPCSVKLVRKAATPVLPTAALSLLEFDRRLSRLRLCSQFLGSGPKTPSSRRRKEKKIRYLRNLHRASADWNCLVFFFSGSVGSE